MSINLKKHCSLKRRLKKKTGVELNHQEYASIAGLILNLAKYCELESPGKIFTSESSDGTRILIPKDMGKLLAALNKLPGGIKGLAIAIGDINIGAVLTEAPRHQRQTEDDGLSAVSKYGLAFFHAITSYYHFYWYFNPDEIAEAEELGRPPDQGNHYDVFHVGLFNLCRKVGEAA